MKQPDVARTHALCAGERSRSSSSDETPSYYIMSVLLLQNMICSLSSYEANPLPTPSASPCAAAQSLPHNLISRTFKPSAKRAARDNGSAKGGVVLVHIHLWGVILLHIHLCPLLCVDRTMERELHDRFRRLLHTYTHSCILDILLIPLSLFFSDNLI